MLYLTHKGAPPLPNTTLEDTKNLELQKNNCSWTSTEEVDPDRLLVGEEIKTKTTDENESSIDNSSAQKNKNIPLPPPPPAPLPPPKEDSDSDFDMGHVSVHITLYEGDEDPRRHWFVCESTWDANAITSEDKHMVQFAGAFRKQALTWYMTYTKKTTNATKADIKQQFSSFFKTPDVKHLTTKKISL